MARGRRPSITPYGRGPPPHGFAAGRIWMAAFHPTADLIDARLFPRRPRPACPIFLEPGEDRRGFGGRLRRARGDAAVAGAGHLDQRGRHAAPAEGGVILFGFADRGAVILGADDHHRRGFEIADERTPRARPVKFVILPRLRAEPIADRKSTRLNSSH